MTTLLTDTPASGPSACAPATPAPRFPARQPSPSWPTTRLARDDVTRLLSVPPFTAPTAEHRYKRKIGVRLLLEWLADQLGESWQQRWQASGAEEAGDTWRRLPAGWLAERGHGRWHQEAIVEVLPVAVGAEVVRPSLQWLVGGGLARGGRLVASLEASRDPDGFARLRSLCTADDRVSATAA